MRATILLFAMLLAVALPAQVVRVANTSTIPFDGRVRCTIDVVPKARAGIIARDDGMLATYVVGRQVGLDTYVVDLRMSLAPKQELVLDLATAKPMAWKLAPLSAKHLEWFGGQISIGGVQCKRLELEPDGAGYTAHWRARVGPMLLTDLWVTWYPDDPTIANAEALVTCSNCSVPDMGATVPENFALRVGKAMVFPAPQLVEAGTQFGDGQSRVIPLVLVSAQHLTSDEAWGAAGVATSRRVSAVGISQLWGCGNPRTLVGCDARKWAEDRLPEALRRLSTFEAGIDGPAPLSGSTGAQGGQGWPYGEPLSHPSAVQVVYLSALQMAARPCHHREADGSQVDPLNHPDLVYWDSRAHWHVGVSPDQLGKPRGLSSGETSGWWGSDVEHWVQTPVLSAARYTGSKALQSLLEAQARVYLLMHTIDPKLIYQSTPFAARATFYEGQVATELWRNLEDRALAERVRTRWQQRVKLVILPAYSAIPGDVWDWRRDDRIGPGIRYMPWQQAAGSFGLDYGCEILGPADGRAVAMRAALAILRDAYWLDGARWTSRDVVAQDGAAVPSGAYDFFGTPLAIATILRNDPTNKQARAIWVQLLKEATEPQQIRWMAPGVR